MGPIEDQVAHWQRKHHFLARHLLAVYTLLVIAVTLGVWGWVRAVVVEVRAWN